MAEKEIGGGERGAGSEERQTERRRSGAVEEVASNPGTHVCASFAAGVGGGSSTVRPRKRSQRTENGGPAAAARGRRPL
ncbi:hypothetical protein Syun_003607 [Stephania yunnanensis]|uniref:Uncharacterized protein n=1 Tax=Stephania yunnanensis TaxID=152371 RepID=A0AAP0L423_9MAGN